MCCDYKAEVQLSFTLHNDAFNIVEKEFLKQYLFNETLR